MSSFNKVLILGNLTRDVELRYMPTGSPVCDFSLALNRKWTGSDGAKKEEVSFIDVTCFGKTAEIASQYLYKGVQTLIEGRLKQDRWEAKEGGGKRSKVKVICERLTLLGGKRDEGERAGGGQGADDSDVPF